MTHLVSYIIPVYNAAPFIERCVRSLMEQSYDNIEYIFVDDCSTDDSVALLQNAVEAYPERREHVRIIRHDRDMGSATARNHGLDAATGDYVMFADSDDYVDADYVASMVSKAEAEQADIVYCDFYETYPQGDKLIRQDYGTDPVRCICSMLSRAQHGSTCNKNFLRKFLLHSRQRFVDGADLFEDVGWNVRLLACQPRLSYLPRAFYHYVKYNSSSIIASMGNKSYSRMRCLQRIKNIDVACRFLSDKGLMRGEVQRAADCWMLMAKNDLITSDLYSLKRWMVTFPEADRAIWHCKGLTVNYRLLLTWLHLRWLPVYRLQKRVAAKLLTPIS